MSACCRGLSQAPGTDRRQTLATLLGAGFAGAVLSAPRQAWAGAT
jgi:hypothetical protein